MAHHRNHTWRFRRSQWLQHHGHGRPVTNFLEKLGVNVVYNNYPGIPTTIRTMGVLFHHHRLPLRVLIIQIGSTITLMVVEAHGLYTRHSNDVWYIFTPTIAIENNHMVGKYTFTLGIWLYYTLPHFEHLPIFRN